jgi:hypothetical protein
VTLRAEHRHHHEAERDPDEAGGGRSMFQGGIAQSTEVNMWWFGSIIFLIIWVLIAFWPARVAARKGHSFFLYFLFSLVFFPAALIVAYMVHDRTGVSERGGEDEMRREVELQRREAELERDAELGPPPLA